MIYVEAHGARIPALGFGTFQLDGGRAGAWSAMPSQIGYRHIDTAQMYGNEAEVGAAIASSGVPRDEIWLTTKIWPDNFRDGALQRAAETSMRRLRYRARSAPAALAEPERAARRDRRALNDAKRRGLARHIGISNFTAALIQEAVAASEAPLHRRSGRVPAVSQPGARARGAARARHGADRLLAAGPGPGVRDPTLARIGERHGKNPGQVTLRWLIQQDGVAAIPRSSREAHAEANLAIFDFALSAAPEIAEISALARTRGRQVDPGGSQPRWD